MAEKLYKEYQKKCMVDQQEWGTAAQRDFMMRVKRFLAYSDGLSSYHLRLKGLLVIYADVLQQTIAAASRMRTLVAPVALRERGISASESLKNQAYAPVAPAPAPAPAPRKHGVQMDALVAPAPLEEALVVPAPWNPFLLKPVPQQMHPPVASAPQEEEDALVRYYSLEPESQSKEPFIPDSPSPKSKFSVMKDVGKSDPAAQTEVLLRHIESSFKPRR